MSLTYNYSAATDIGSRETNQDNFSVCGDIPFFFTDENYIVPVSTSGDLPALFAVCDGVGSRRDSAETAQLALRLLCCEFRKYREATNKEEWVCEAVRCIQKGIAEFLRETGKNGSNTLAFLVIDEDFFIFANIGDSPAFILKRNDGTVTELSVRHNLETYHRLTGKPVGPDDSRYLLYAFGSNSFDLSKVVNIKDGVLNHGDCFIICSDGVSNALTEDEITDMLRNGASADDFTRIAAIAPEADNCTAIVIRLT